MKKVSGLSLLLVACFLFSMQLAAEPSGASNGIALDATVVESKIIMKEEVAVSIYSETVTFEVAVLKTIATSLLLLTLSVTAYFAVLGHLNYTTKKTHGVEMQSLTDQFA